MLKRLQRVRASLSARPRHSAATLTLVGWGAVLVLAGLAGCGQKGALVLPPPEPAASAPR